MLETLINLANILVLAGCFYAAYLTARAFPARTHRTDGASQRAPADHERLFRSPCADYYI